ncbi:GA4 desaturase [Polychaeton citri CBS 116435]|uniref:GA4 desaturase n=1 Tax=Polychaeton citri CBS 116435 TaxID=1314669 RepID=A0A9P4Q831_9PEZI|nr:GA4 desaturase [Polychaeton citri CBS 116435]
MVAVTDVQHWGKFRYLTRGTKPARSNEAYLLPPLSEFGNILTLPLIDMRPSLDLGNDSPYKLSVHGFTARRHHSSLLAAPYDRACWTDEGLLRTVYFPEVQALVQELTGCKKLVVSAAVLRNKIYEEGDSPPEQPARPKSGHGTDDISQPFPPIVGNSATDRVSPAPKVHLDFSPKGARYHIRKYHNDVASAAERVIEAENQLLESGVQWDDLKDYYHGNGSSDQGIPRFALFSIWRPLKPIDKDPLALSSCASFPESDYVPSNQLEPADQSIPAHLSRVIDPNALHSNVNDEYQVQDVAIDTADGTYQSQGYLPYGPRDKEQKSHDWHFISDQQPSEVLIIQLFDNEMEAHARAPKEGSGEVSNLGVGGAVHSAFELVGQDACAEARESIEVRCAAFW